MGSFAGISISYDPKLKFTFSHFNVSSFMPPIIDKIPILSQQNSTKLTYRGQERENGQGFSIFANVFDNVQL